MSNTETVASSARYDADGGIIIQTLYIFQSEWHQGALMELRALNAYHQPNAQEKSKTVGGWYNDIEQMGRAVLELAKWGQGAIYFTINPVMPGANKARLNECGKRSITTTDNDIMKRRWVFLDFDPCRPTNTCSTDEEKGAALALRDQVMEYLSERGFQYPLLADSGNGYHVYYNVEMPNGKAETALIKEFLAALSFKFSNDDVKIDTTVYNAARITRLYGTWNIKGLSTPERPHRISQLLVGDRKEWLPTDRERFAAVVMEIATEKDAAQRGEAAQSGNRRRRNLHSERGSSEPFNLELWLDEHGIEHRGAEPMTDGRTRYTLLRCPFDESHEGKDAAVFQGEGGLGFKCFHDSCADKGWKDFRKLIEPTYDPDRAQDVTGYSTDSETALLYLMIDEAVQFRRNRLTDQIEYQSIQRPEQGWQQFTDVEANSLKVMAVRERGLGTAKVQHIWEYAQSLYTPAYHPVRDYLNGLEWDQQDHIGRLCAHLRTEDDNLFHEYLSAWTIRAVDQALTGEPNEYMIVLSGAQGIGKTTFARCLVPPTLRTHFHSGKCDASNKDGLEIMARSWVISDDELNGLRKSEVEAIKSMLSMRDVTYRPPYGRVAVTKPRLASFIGGTNEDQFLSDPTGSRRFLAIQVHEIDHQALRAFNIHQFWAQAMARYQRGERGFLSESTKQRQAEVNAAKGEENVFDYYVRRFVRTSLRRQDWISATDLAHHVARELGEEKTSPRVDNTFTRRLAAALKSAGHEQFRANGLRLWQIRALSRHDLSTIWETDASCESPYERSEQPGLREQASPQELCDEPMLHDIGDLGPF